MENILKNGMKVIAPSGCEEYLTPNKEYEVFNVQKEREPFFCSFKTIADNGSEMFTLLNKSTHLLGGNWIIKNESIKSQLIPLIKTHILEYNKPNGSMEQFEIDGFAYDVDYTSTIHVKEGMPSGDWDVPNDNDTLTVELYTIDIRNVWDEDGNMLEAEQLKEINKEFYILN